MTTAKLDRRPAIALTIAAALLIAISAMFFAMIRQFVMTILLAANGAARAESSREARMVAAYTERAQKLMKIAGGVDGTAARLRHLERAARHLDRAYRLDRAAARLRAAARSHLPAPGVDQADRSAAGLATGQPRRRDPASG